MWYNSRFYRFNLFWNEQGIFIRDIHQFDEARESVTHDTALAATSLAYETLPIVEGVQPFSEEVAGAFPVWKLDTGQTAPMLPEGPPSVSEQNEFELVVSQPLRGGGKLIVRCQEFQVSIEVSAAGKSPDWELEFRGQLSPAKIATESTAIFKSATGPFQVCLSPGGGSFHKGDDGSLWIRSNAEGLMTLVLSTEPSKEDNRD